MTPDDDEALVQILSNQGCSEDEIDQIMRKLQEYDNRMIRESVFESIASGNFDLKSFIDEVKNLPS